ncbi:MAG: hypothetical protein E6Q83_13210 [Thiothrix sp.]|nr:MAG: hypothetical protein E6Q83_13210 [Thiothrix sp.]
MHCYLHIGTEKTGTTLIQEFLHLNAEQLERVGLVYLRSAGYPNNKWLALAAFDVDRRDRWTVDKKVNTNEDMLDLQTRLAAEIQMELASKQPKSVVFSSEHFQSRLTRINEIKRLKEILISLGFNSFSVIVYLRDPLELASSLYSTAIKMGNTAALRPSLPTAPNYKDLCDHQATIERFSQVFTAQDSQLIVRLFERTELKNQSVLDDFLALLGLDQLDGFVMPKAENKSLSNLGLALLRRVNAQIPNLNEKDSILMRAQVIAKFERYFTEDRYVMPPEVHKAYEQAFKDSNEWVRARFFSSRASLFKPNTRPQAHVELPDSPLLDKVADLFCRAWLSDRQ